MQGTQLISKEEKIRCIRGTAKDDDGGGWPFHEVPCFDTVDAGLAWAQEARANPKQYRYIKLDVDYDVKEKRRDAQGREYTCYYQRAERPFEYNAAIEDDTLYYERMKQYGMIAEGDWVVIRDRRLVVQTRDEGMAWKSASRSTQRALVRCVGQESPDDERDIGTIVRRAASFAR